MYKTYKELDDEISKRKYKNIIGLKANITEENYYYFLEVLPPIYTHNGNGFILSEFLTHNDKGAISYLFKQDTTGYTCEVVQVNDYISNKILVENGFL